MARVALFAEILIEDFDGASRTIFQLINRIHTSAHHFMFVYGTGPQQLQHFDSFKTPSLRLPVNDDYSLALPALTKQTLYNRLDAFSPEVIHISTPSPLGFFALRYAQKRRIPVITIYHTHFISYIPYYFRNMTFLIKPVQQWMSASMVRFYNACDTIYLPTRRMTEELNLMGINPLKMNLWGRGINLGLFSPDKKDPTYFTSLMGNGKRNILFASRLVWEKNIRTLIDIARIITQKKLPYNLIVAGDGVARREAEHLMPDACFIGKQNHEQLAIAYASADVFLFTSTSETYGNVVIEAMASGTACVIADAGGSADLVQHSHTGFKCPAFSRQAYVDCIAHIFADTALRSKVQKNALEYVRGLNWDLLAQRYFNDIELLSKKNQEDTWAYNAS